MESLDLAEYRAVYLAQRESSATEINNIIDFDIEVHPDLRSPCFRDHSGNYVHKNGECPKDTGLWLGATGPLCPFERWELCDDHVRWIDTAKFLSCYFRNPTGACSQRILNGFAEHCFIHYYKNIRPTVRDIGETGFSTTDSRPQNRYLILDGLYLSTRLNISRGICVLSGLVILVVLGGKLVWNSWEVVFGAGSFLVAIPMLAMAAITYFEP
jgi:hypothetical protein